VHAGSRSAAPCRPAFVLRGTSTTSGLFSSLALTIGWPDPKIDQFDRFRKKRNIIGYETAEIVSEREAREMHNLAETLREDVLAWLRKQYPKLLKR